MVLAMTAVAAIVPLVPTVLQKVEYRSTEDRLEKRPLGKEEAREFERVFRWGELSHVLAVSNGFKFYKPLGESNPFVRFWKLHVSDKYSGEVHVEKQDQKRVNELLKELGVIIR